MPTPNSLPIPNTPFLDMRTGLVTREWTRFLYSLNRNSSDAVAGEVQTDPGSGLQGGGFVADGIDLSIAPNGVTNAMIREGQGTSVIGRYQNSNGDVADIKAVQNRTVLQRRSDQLSFFPDLDVPAVATDALTLNQTPTAEVVVCTHTVIININGTDYKFPCVAA